MQGQFDDAEQGGGSGDEYDPDPTPPRARRAFVSSRHLGVSTLPLLLLGGRSACALFPPPLQKKVLV